jgi:hypothetical protein
MIRLLQIALVAGGRGEGVDGIDAIAADRSVVGKQHVIGGVTITLV